ASLLDDLLQDLLRLIVRDSFAEERGGTSLLPVRVALMEARDDVAQLLLYGALLFAVSAVLARLVQLHQQVFERRIFQLEHQPLEGRRQTPLSQSATLFVQRAAAQRGELPRR